MTEKQKEILNAAYEKGWDDAPHHRDNPYKFGSPEYEQYENGFYDASMEYAD